MTSLTLRGLYGLAWLLVAAGCGAPNQSTNQRSGQSGDPTSPASQNGADSSGQPVRLAQANTDQVLGTLVIPFGKNGASLTGPSGSAIHWVVDMQDEVDVQAGVAPDKYLKVTGDLAVPMNAQNQPYEIGCIFVDLKDNVYYREQTWLRLATTGITGKEYSEVTLPLSVDDGGWQTVPTLGTSSITLQQFAGETIKKFNGTLCFKLDFTNAPAQEYEGELIVQYLRPGAATNPPACDMADTRAAIVCQPQTCDGGTPPPTAPAPTPAAPPAVFACASQPAVLKAGQQTTLSWSDVAEGQELVVQLSADDPSYTGQLGTAVAAADHVVYTAPSAVPAAVKILVSARPSNSEVLPAFCSVSLTPDGAIGIVDDGETNGLPGNVYQLPANTDKLPDFSTLKPVQALLASNLDVPNTYYTQGFPSVNNMIEWFGIQFKGELLVPADETCAFELAADDGANLYLDGTKIVDDDGIHPIQTATGSATLTKGPHAIRVDYYQGPRYYIALQLSWKCGADTAFTIIPPAAFSRPLQ